MRRTSLLFLIAFVLICRTGIAHADFRYMGGSHPFIPLSDSTELTLSPGSSLTFPINKPSKGEIRLSAMIDALPDAKKEGHGFIITTEADTFSLTFTSLASSDHIYNQDGLQLTVSSPHTGYAKSFTLSATPDRYMLGKKPVLTLSLTPISDRYSKAIILGGRFQDETLWTTDTLPLSYAEITGIGFTAGSSSQLAIQRTSLVTPDPDSRISLQPADIALQLSRATDPYSGYWTILDYSLDDSMLRSGGNYTLALLPASDGGYEIIYIEGANINPADWTAGTHKGHLTPTLLAGLYRADWTDAEGNSLDYSATLQFLGTDIAQLSLPSLHSTIRLHRVRP